MTAATATDGQQVLEFTIDGEPYCVEIEHVREIVDGSQKTSVPGTPDHVEDVMDLRGRTTTIVNPRTLLEIGGADPGDLVSDGGTNAERVIVLDENVVSGDGSMGWVVSDVDRVISVPSNPESVEAVTDTDLIRGVVREDDDNDDFIIWVNAEKLVA